MHHQSALIPRRKVLAAAAVLALLGAGAGTVAYLDYRSTPLIELFHLPASYPRRSEHLSANVSGRVLTRHVRGIRYQVNGGDWRDFHWLEARTPFPMFTLEMPAGSLVAGENRLTIEVRSRFRPPEIHERTFRYDPSPIALPMRVEWQGKELEVQDGYWERVSIDGQWRVRPVPGYEGYDRILLATGAFPAGRRLQTDVIFRGVQPGQVEHVVGLLGMWAGHPDDWSSMPRRGWSFAMTCFWSKPGGAGLEISHKSGLENPRWINSYRSLELERNVRYHVLFEIQPELDSEGRHLAYLQRTKWWREGEAPPAEWIVAADVEGAPLPEGEFAVALLLYRCQADFGPIDIQPLPPILRPR